MINNKKRHKSDYNGINNINDEGLNENAEADTTRNKNDEAFEQDEESTLSDFGILRSHDHNYVASRKKIREALISVCCTDNSKRIALSVKQTRELIGYLGDWLDIKYSDKKKAVLIGNSTEERGIKPIITDKKYLIYDSLTVKDFEETLCLDFDNRASLSAYTEKTVMINGVSYIVLTHDDFV